MEAAIKTRKHLLVSNDLSKTDILFILEKANSYSQKSTYPKIYENKVVANLFFENSTRTRFSFEIAEKKLGADVINFIAESSSLAKGETLEDTLKTLKAIGVDVAVVRHSDDHLLQSLRTRTELSLINAGAGKKEHPTQGLLDLLTIKQEFASIDGLKIAIVGDIKYSRVAGSLIGLTQCFDTKLFLCGPESVVPTADKIPAHCELAKIDDIIAEVDVVVLLRIQTERHVGLEVRKEDYLPEYGLTHARLDKMKAKSIIMHPAPVNRGVEIASDLVEHKKSRIFKQMSNGVFTRMAILEWVMQ
jgi:aspartate carbamoyltransferase catalytic subunit